MSRESAVERGTSTWMRQHRARRAGAVVTGGMVQVDGAHHDREIEEAAQQGHQGESLNPMVRHLGGMGTENYLG